MLPVVGEHAGDRRGQRLGVGGHQPVHALADGRPSASELEQREIVLLENPPGEIGAHHGVHRRDGGPWTGGLHRQLIGAQFRLPRRGSGGERVEPRVQGEEPPPGHTRLLADMVQEDHPAHDFRRGRGVAPREMTQLVGKHRPQFVAGEGGEQGQADL